MTHVAHTFLVRLCFGGEPDNYQVVAADSAVKAAMKMFSRTVYSWPEVVELEATSRPNGTTVTLIRLTVADSPDVVSIEVQDMTRGQALGG
jgi:hypothetical protein